MSIRPDIAAAEAAGAARQLGEATNGKADGGTPNDFYALWLDRRMIYSCASFHSFNDDLDTAQKHRLNALCCALRLGPGRRLLDVGCGCGGLVIYAAEQFGADATGVTLSQPQANLANQRLAANPRIAAAGLGGRRVQVCHYRRVDAPPESYDALASIGMAQRIGDFAWALRLLRPGGALAMHVMTGQRLRSADFTDTYAFPGGEPSPLGLTLHAAERAGFEVRAVENLRNDFRLTLRHWMHRLEVHHDQALRFVDEPTYRAWRLFMSDLAHGFRVGSVNAYQILLVKPKRTNGHNAAQA